MTGGPGPPRSPAARVAMHARGLARQCDVTSVRLVLLLSCLPQEVLDEAIRLSTDDYEAYASAGPSVGRMGREEMAM